MDVYEILIWCGLAFWIICFYPYTIFFAFKKTIPFGNSYVILELIEFFIMLLGLFTRIFFSKESLDPITIQSLVFTSHALLHSGIYSLACLEQDYDFYRNIPNCTKLVIILAWGYSVVLFIMFGASDIDLSFSIGDNIVHNEFYILIVAFFLDLFKYWALIINNISEDVVSEMNSLALMFQFIGSSLWTTSIIMQLSTEKNYSYWLNNIGIASVGMWGLLFTTFLIMIKRKSHKVYYSTHNYSY